MFTKRYSTTFGTVTPVSRESLERLGAATHALAKNAEKREKTDVSDALPVAHLYESAFLRDRFRFSYDVQAIGLGFDGAVDFDDRVMVITPNTYEALRADDHHARIQTMRLIYTVLLHRKQLTGQGIVVYVGESVIENRSGRLTTNRDWQATTAAMASILPFPMLNRYLAQGMDSHEIGARFGVPEKEVRMRTIELKSHWLFSSEGGWKL